VLSAVAVFSGGNLSLGVREDRADRWVIVAFGLIGLLDAYLPAYTDRKEFAARVSEGAVWVLQEGAVIAAIMVLLPGAELSAPRQHRLSPTRQGLGLGRRLLAFAEDEALRRGYREIRLYTHQTMVENQRLYASIGYEEKGRGIEAGYNRVFMRKQLRD
jgi:GNAT superfamily N-acetyltransferase